MAIKFTSVAYVILQVTKKKTTQEKKQQQQRTQKNERMNNFVITESAQSKLFLWLLYELFGYYIKYLIYQHIDLISGQG